MTLQLGKIPFGDGGTRTAPVVILQEDNDAVLVLSNGVDSEISFSCKAGRLRVEITGGLDFAVNGTVVHSI